MKKMQNLVRLMCLSLMIIMFFAFVGCGNSDANVDYEGNVANLDMEDIIAQEWNNSISSDQPEFLNLFDQISSYLIVDVSEETDGYYSVVLEVSAPDISELIINYQTEIENGIYGDNISEADMNNKLCELINSASIKTTQHTIAVIVDNEGVAHVNFTQDFVNAMFGYAYDAAIENVADLLQ